MQCFALVASTYGWSHDTILSLTVRQFLLYLQEIDMIETRQQMHRIEASSFPDMEKGDRQKVTDRLQKVLTPRQLIYDKGSVEQSWKLLRLGKIS